MYRTAPFQNPATARTAGSCERTGAAKAPVLSPAIFLTGRFTLDSGGSVFQQSSLPSVTRCRQELKTCSGGHMDAAPAPFAPHSGSQGQTGGFSTPFCETAVLFVNGIVIPALGECAFLLSALRPSGRKSGCGRQPAKCVWLPVASQPLCLPTTEGLLIQCDSICNQPGKHKNTDQAENFPAWPAKFVQVSDF